MQSLKISGGVRSVSWLSMSLALSNLDLWRDPHSTGDLLQVDHESANPSVLSTGDVDVEPTQPLIELGGTPFVCQRHELDAAGPAPRRCLSECVDESAPNATALCSRLDCDVSENGAIRSSTACGCLRRRLRKPSEDAADVTEKARPEELLSHRGTSDESHGARHHEPHPLSAQDEVAVRCSALRADHEADWMAVALRDQRHAMWTNDERSMVGAKIPLSKPCEEPVGQTLGVQTRKPSKVMSASVSDLNTSGTNRRGHQLTMTQCRS